MFVILICILYLPPINFLLPLPLPSLPLPLLLLVETGSKRCRSRHCQQEGIQCRSLIEVLRRKSQYKVQCHSELPKCQGVSHPKVLPVSFEIYIKMFALMGGKRARQTYQIHLCLTRPVHYTFLTFQAFGNDQAA